MSKYIQHYAPKLSEVEISKKPSIWESTKKQGFWHLDLLFCFFCCMDFYLVSVILPTVTEKDACTSKKSKNKLSFSFNNVLSGLQNLLLKLFSQKCLSR